MELRRCDVGVTDNEYEDLLKAERAAKRLLKKNHYA
jgi:hypothetical protein